MAATLLLGACATVPDLPPSAVARDPGGLASARSLPAGTAAWPDDRWWRTYGDPQLDALVAEALAAAPDIAVAAARAADAAALAEQAGAVLVPTFEAQGGVSAQQQSRNIGIPPQFVPAGIRSSGQAALSSRFDLDLWGRNRAQLAAATSEAEAARVDAAQARLLLSTGVVAAYADLAAGLDRLAVAQRSLALRRATAALTAQRVTAGLDNASASAQADSRAAAAAAEVKAVEEAVLLTRHRLAALIGAGPDRGLDIAPPRLGPPPAGLPPGIGIDLVGRRPDLVAARLRAQAASGRVRAARADFYPNISLSALVGFQSLGIERLFESNSVIVNAGPAINLPILDGGQRAGRFRQARAGQDTAVARYDAALLAALREVADAVTSRDASAAQAADQQAALAAAEEARRLAALRYGAGLSGQLPVLTADDSVVAAQRAVADLNARRLAADVALVRALGGGYRSAG